VEGTHIGSVTMGHGSSLITISPPLSSLADID
jgi:hypothetical protein